MNHPNLPAALTAWQSCLGAERVLAADAAQRRYNPSAIGHDQGISAALLIEHRTQITKVLDIARHHGVPLYPISTGNNWGYGSAHPVLPGCVILDLSGMNRILELDAELGLVTIEPGVTQGRLRQYLDERAPGFMVPTTGAGPNCSLIGNALERGYGITPHADHFGAVTALEAVLPDGRVYRSALTELGAEGIDRTFKWGLGPYADGLFAQGNIGVVTQMTIALAPRPERIEAFFFGIPDEQKLEAATLAVQRLLRELGTTVGSVNLMNARRVLAMAAPYPADRIGRDGILPDDVVRDLARRHQVRPWMGVGALYGNARVVKAARRVVRKILHPAIDRVVFMTPERSAFLGSVFHKAPILSRIAERFGVADITGLLRTVDEALEVMVGRPSEVALRLAYWRSRNLPDTGMLNPARDGCGLIWYSPVVPMKPKPVRDYVAMVHQLCAEHGIEPLITLTSLGDRCFDSTVPLLFDRNDDAQTARARACFDALFTAGRSQGVMPYRLGVQVMERITNTHSPFWDLVRTIKAAVDPAHIIAPGRYAPSSLDRRSVLPDVVK